MLERHQLSHQISGHLPQPHQISGHREACPLAARTASFARRVGSKPTQAQQASRQPPIGRLMARLSIA